MNITLKLGEVLTAHAPDGGELLVVRDIPNERCRYVTISAGPKLSPVFASGPDDGLFRGSAAAPLSKPAKVGRVKWKPTAAMIGKFEEVG